MSGGQESSLELMRSGNAGTSNNADESLSSKVTGGEARYLDSDEKFRRFIIGHLFRDGLHVWWILGIFGIITVLSIIFSFFAAFVDAQILLMQGSQLATTAVAACKSLYENGQLDETWFSTLTKEEQKRCHQLQRDFGDTGIQHVQQLGTAIRSKRELYQM